MLTSIETAKQIASKMTHPTTPGGKLSSAMQQDNERYIGTEQEQQQMVMRYATMCCAMALPYIRHVQHSGDLQLSRQHGTYDLSSSLYILCAQLLRVASSCIFVTAIGAHADAELIAALASRCRFESSSLV